MQIINNANHSIKAEITTGYGIPPSQYVTLFYNPHRTGLFLTIRHKEPSHIVDLTNPRFILLYNDRYITSQETNAPQEEKHVKNLSSNNISILLSDIIDIPPHTTYVYPVKAGIAVKIFNDPAASQGYSLSPEEGVIYNEQEGSRKASMRDLMKFMNQKMISVPEYQIRYAETFLPCI